MVTSRSDGTFLTGRCKTSLKVAAVSKMSWISSGGRFLIPSKCGVERLIKEQRYRNKAFTKALIVELGCITFGFPQLNVENIE
jgi:hypothetical protein